MLRFRKVLSLMLAISMILGVTGFAGAAEESGITLIGENYGTMKSVLVDDCAELTSALELNCTSIPTENGFGINIPTAQFGLVSGKVYVLSFYSKLSDVFDTLTVSINNASGTKLTGFTYQLSGQWTKICVPFTATGNEANIKMTIGGKVQKIYIGGISVEVSDTTFEEAKSGYFMVESDEWETVDISWSAGLGVGNCMDVTAVGEYIYALAGGKLHTFKIGGRGENPTLINSTQAYGDLRQMSVTDDKKGIIVTARANEILAFDISDPEKPVLASRIDSLEAATGIDIQGKYCYIADRLFGVDIFDISDLYNPVMVSNIPTGETQDCKVYNGYLYAGVWGSCKVTICDVRNPDSPSIVGNISLKGRGDGVNIKNGILYAATGHMEGGTPQATSPGYALGNGMEIYDITDPTNPVLLSRVRAEGRMYCSSPDIWRVEVSGNYAYLSSTYNGIYVYDTTNKRLPKRLAHINVVANKGESGYSYSTPKSTWVYPYDITQKRCGALIDCDVKNGTMYIANASSNLYVLHGKDYIADSTDDDDSTVFPSSDYSKTYFTNDLEAMGFKNTKLFKPDSQIWSCARYGDYTYVAAGTDGIYVIDDDMNIIKNYPTHDITNDIRIYENKIYTAENTAGLFIYEIDIDNPENITYMGSYTQGSSPIVEIALSPDARYALVQRSNISMLLDVSDKNNPTLYKNFSYSMVYQNQISRECAQNRYLMVFANGSKTVVCDFGENGSYDKPIINESWTSGITQLYGISADGDLMLATASNKVFSFDPSNEDVYTSTLASNANVKSFSVSGLTGAPTVIGNYAFIASRNNGNLTILKLSEDRTSAPEVSKKVSFKGSPARATSVGRRVYLPLGYGGLASFEISDLTPNLSTLSALSYKTDSGFGGAVDGFKASDIGGEYEISVLDDVKKVEILAKPTVSDSVVTISNGGIIDIENGEREAVVTVSNGSDTSEFKVKVNIIALTNAKTYTIPGHEDITMQLEVNPLITAVRADSGDNLIYPGQPLENGSRFYSDRTADRMLYLDVGDKLKGTTPILNPINDVRTVENRQSAIGDEYYFRFVADRGGTVVVKYKDALSVFENDSSWAKVYENTTGGSKTNLSAYTRTSAADVIPTWYNYTGASDYPYYCTMYQYAADASAKTNYFAYYKYTYYKHFDAGEVVALSRKDITAQHNFITLIDWDKKETAAVNLTALNGTISADINGSTSEINGVLTNEYDVGSTVVLTAGEGNFMYYKDDISGRILSTDKTYEFAVGSDRSISAYFRSETDSGVYYIMFKNANGKIISSGYTSSEIAVPNNPYLSGYVFDGWYDDNEKLAITAGSNISGYGFEKDTIIKAGFKLSEQLYNVYFANEGEQVYGQYKYNEAVTLKAPEVSGKVFVYWKRDGQIVSYNETYTFRMGLSDTVAEAVFADTAEEKVPVIIMFEPVVLTGEGRISFMAERDADECKVIESGILLSQSAGIVLENAEYKAQTLSNLPKGQFTIRKANLNAGDKWYARAYMIYEKDGEVITAYSNEVSAVYN